MSEVDTLESEIGFEDDANFLHVEDAPSFAPEEREDEPRIEAREQETSEGELSADKEAGYGTEEERSEFEPGVQALIENGRGGQDPAAWEKTGNERGVWVLDLAKGIFNPGTGEHYSAKDPETAAATEQDAIRHWSAENANAYLSIPGATEQVEGGTIVHEFLLVRGEQLDESRWQLGYEWYQRFIPDEKDEEEAMEEIQADTAQESRHVWNEEGAVRLFETVAPATEYAFAETEAMIAQPEERLLEVEQAFEEHVAHTVVETATPLAAAERPDAATEEQEATLESLPVFEPSAQVSEPVQQNIMYETLLTFLQRDVEPARDVPRDESDGAVAPALEKNPETPPEKNATPDLVVAGMETPVEAGPDSSAPAVTSEIVAPAVAAPTETVPETPVAIPSLVDRAFAGHPTPSREQATAEKIETADRTSVGRDIRAETGIAARAAGALERETAERSDTDTLDAVKEGSVAPSERVELNAESFARAEPIVRLVFGLPHTDARGVHNPERLNVRDIGRGTRGMHADPQDRAATYGRNTPPRSRMRDGIRLQLAA